MKRPVVINGSQVTQWDLNCPDCRAPMIIASFDGRICYRCTVPECHGMHGAHKDGTPLGVPADEKTRKARSAAHCAFDRIWEVGKMTRGEAYAWLSKVMGLNEAHIGGFDIEQCKKVVAAVKKKEFPELFPFSDDVP